MICSEVDEQFTECKDYDQWKEMEREASIQVNEDKVFVCVDYQFTGWKSISAEVRVFHSEFEVNIDRYVSRFIISELKKYLVKRYDYLSTKI